MEYGILVARYEHIFQIVGVVSSIDEAKEMAHIYDKPALLVEHVVLSAVYEIHRRDSFGFYTIIEMISL